MTQNQNGNQIQSHSSDDIYMRLGLVLHEDIYILIVLSTCSKGFNEEYLAAYSMMENFMRGYNHNSIEV